MSIFDWILLATSVAGFLCTMWLLAWSLCWAAADGETQDSK